MSPERWRQVEELFHRALEVPDAERVAWVEAQCGGDAELQAEVLSLVASDNEAAGKFVGAQVEHAVRAMDKEPELGVRRVGPYKLLEELGHGGMGAVYLAVRADEQYESRVAIKLVRPGLDTEFILKRFRRERQILARLEHANIARLLDGGTTEAGVPYIVMEYVDGGKWITKYATENALNVEERLHLFLPVCAAVGHAHRHFVVHRDLKPGNILIDGEGTPKLLDFGISKLLHMDLANDSETREVHMMTPDYASPEQITGDAITIASDIYSLGAVLYELLTGKRPHQLKNLSPLELERAICEQETLAPSAAARPHETLEKRLAGDLDVIVLRAMQKAPARRYASVEELAEDIRRHLGNRPILSRPDTMMYRVGKFWRRNRLPASLTVVAAGSMIAGTAISIYQAHVAQQRFDQVRKLASTFVFDVEAEARNLPGSMKVRQIIANTGREYLDNLASSSARDWELKRELAAAYERLGDVQGGTHTSNLGNPEAALASYRKAEALLDEVLAHEPSNRKALTDWLNLLGLIGDLQVNHGQEKESLATYQRGMARLEEALGSGGDIDLEHQAASYLFDLARGLRMAGDVQGALERVTRGTELMEKVAAAKPDDKEAHINLSTGYAQLGAVLSEKRQSAEALAMFRKGLAALEKVCEKHPADTRARHELMLAYSHVGDMLGNPAFGNLNDRAGALAAYRKMVDAARVLYEADAADTRAVMDYGIATLRLGLAMPEGAEKMATLRKSEEVLTLSVKQNPKNSMAAVHKGWVEEEIGDQIRAKDRAGAIGQYQRAAASAEAVLAVEAASRSGQFRLTSALGKLATEQARAGQPAMALGNLHRLVQLAHDVKKNLPPLLAHRSVVGRALHNAGDGYVVLAETDRAERARHIAAAKECYTEALDAWRPFTGDKGFLPNHRKEMDTVAAALAKLTGGAF